MSISIITKVCTPFWLAENPEGIELIHAAGISAAGLNLKRLTLD
jgi:hypothetical protein